MYDDVDGWFTLVLEDLADAEVGDQIAGCGLDEARLAIRTLAQLHAPFVQEPSLSDVDYLEPAEPVRLGRVPNRTAACTWPQSCGSGHPSITFFDPEAPLPPADDDRQVVDTADWHAEQVCVDPLLAFRVSLSGTARAHDDDAGPLRGEQGVPVQIAMELEWQTDGVPYTWRQSTRYEIPCRVTGTVTVDGRTFRLDGPGQCDHSWGARDWWAQDWVWSAFHLDDGTHLHAVTTPTLPGYGVGYVQRGSEIAEIQTGTSVEQVTENGLVVSALITVAHALPARTRARPGLAMAAEVAVRFDRVEPQPNENDLECARRDSNP